jgi:hypothetical protein
MMINLPFRIICLSLATLTTSVAAAQTSAQDGAPFDGHEWNLSTGNLSVAYIQASPIGSHPQDDFHEPPPSADSLTAMKHAGLVADEDYIAWGAVERDPGTWDWSQHDAMERALHKAGLKYVAYCWVHFPPVWLRDKPSERTLMRCMEHNEDTNYLSIFDPHTIEWYDHFYKNLHDHFGDRIDDVYACILGPYGEGNYPLEVPAWIDMGHCHEGYWCGDEYATKAFQAAMEKKYGDVQKLGEAWGVVPNGFEELRAPRQLSQEDFKPTPEAFPTPHQRRQWLDFITWYHQALIDFAEQSVKTTLKYFPASKVRIKPGGSAGGVNPIAWGTYCPGYARMAKNYGIVLQPADCQGAVFADKWMGTAYQFYDVKESTEPATALDEKTFRRRIFSDASAGASQFFTYEFPQHEADIHKFIHLITGRPGDTQVAVYCPTTMYRLGADLKPTIDASQKLRDLCDFDVLDEALILDGALDPKSYKVMIVFQADIVDEPVLDKFTHFQRAGGKIIVVGDISIKDVEDRPWDGSSKVQVVQNTPESHWLAELAPRLAGLTGVDGKLDGVWTTHRGKQVFALNTTSKPATVEIAGKSVTIEPNQIYVSPNRQTQ